MRLRDIPFDVSWAVGEDLRERPNNPDDMHRAIAYLLERAGDDPEIWGLIGSFARMLGQLEQAHDVLQHALMLSRRHPDRKRHTLINGVRLAHVYQWRGDFETSTLLFNELLLRATTDPALAQYEHFVQQHAGKNCFTQGDYAGALRHFRRALALRRHTGDAERIRSTLVAVSAATARLQQSHKA